MEQLVAAMPTDISKPTTTDFRKLLAFGSGVGMEIGPNDLEIAVTRVRPNRIQVLGRMTIHDFAARPAAEWGAEYGRFLKACGAERLSATVLLPRREVIVRQITLPGVAEKDLEGAIRFQLDTLHPYGDDEVVWGWSRLDYGAVLVGIALRRTIERYVGLFVEAGVAVRSFTFSASAVHAAIRMNGGGHGEGFVALSYTASGAVEIYGESPAKPVFSAEFDLPPQRAAMLAISELRLAGDSAPKTLEEVLPKPGVNPVMNDLSRNALPYATALSGSCPWLTPSVNVLPAEYRRFNSRTVFIPTMVLGGLLLLVIISMFVYGQWSEKQYLKQVDAEIARLEPSRRWADLLDKDTEHTRARALLLNDFSKQTRLDLDALNELTHLLEPPTWSNNIEISRDSIRIAGETPQTAQLLRILDSSPFFEKTEIQMSAPRANGEAFQIRTNRRRGK
ncbi:MAG: PilN domain-containing protein [Candidatus Solibacter sp.]